MIGVSIGSIACYSLTNRIDKRTITSNLENYIIDIKRYKNIIFNNSEEPDVSFWKKNKIELEDKSLHLITKFNVLFYSTESFSTSNYNSGPTIAKVIADAYKSDDINKNIKNLSPSLISNYISRIDYLLQDFNNLLISISVSKNPYNFCIVPLMSLKNAKELVNRHNLIKKYCIPVIKEYEKNRGYTIDINELNPDTFIENVCKCFIIESDKQEIIDHAKSIEFIK